MPQIDMTITISVIVALAAIVSPVLTALINNNHHKKIKELEMKQTEYEQTILYKRNIFENYLKSLSMVAHYHSEENINFYSEYYPLAYMYSSPEVRNKILQANEFITNLQWRSAIPYIDEISILVSEELKKL